MAGVPEHLSRCVGVFRVHIGQQDLLPDADASGDRLCLAKLPPGRLLT